MNADYIMLCILTGLTIALATWIYRNAGKFEWGFTYRPAIKKPKVKRSATELLADVAKWEARYKCLNRFAYGCVFIGLLFTGSPIAILAGFAGLLWLDSQKDSQLKT